MIIAKGNVSTAEGPVPVENLKPECWWWTGAIGQGTC
jgi:hypothetical protein